MKTLNYINLISVGIPCFLFALAMGNAVYSFGGMIALIWTGLFQVVIGFMMAFDKPENIYLRIYVIAVIIFFLLLIVTDWEWIWAMPPGLAVYFSVLMFIEAKRETLKKSQR